VKYTNPVLRLLYASAIGLPTPINLDYLYDFGSLLTLHNFGALIGLLFLVEFSHIIVTKLIWT